MRNLLLFSVIGFLSLWSCLASSGESAGGLQTVATAETKSSESKDIQELFNALETNMFPPSAFAAITLTSFKDKEVVKELNFEFVSKAGNVLIEIKGPKVDRGKYILKSGSDLWMYFSSIRRSIRIAARESFMGTDANNYDLLELDLVNGYKIVSHSTEIVDGRKLIRAELEAKPDTEGYARIVSYLDPEKKTIIKNDCYAISGTLLKTISYFDYYHVGPYNVPGKITYVSQLEAGRHSIMTMNRVEQKAELDSGLFSLGYLESLN